MMPLVPVAIVAFAVLGLATPVLADSWRMSPKLTCFVPQVRGNGASITKQVHASKNFIGDLLGISDADAAELDVVYNDAVASIDIVRRCDGEVMDELSVGVSSENAPGPVVNNKQSYAQTFFADPDDDWGNLGVVGAILCPVVLRIDGGQVTKAGGSCIGTIRTSQHSCQVEFKIGGKFVPKGPC